MKRAKNFPPVNIDKKLLEFKNSVKDDNCVNLTRARHKLMLWANQESVENGPKSDAISMPRPTTSTRELAKREVKTPNQQSKSQKPKSKTPKNIESIDLVASCSVDDSPGVNKNAFWSLKCKEIVEQLRQKPIKSSNVVDKLNTVLERASQNGLNYSDFKNLEKILQIVNKLN